MESVLNLPAVFVVFLMMGLLIVGVSVFVGLRLKNSRQHKLRREEMLALKTSGATPSMPLSGLCR